MGLSEPKTYRARIEALHHLRAALNTKSKKASGSRKKELEQQVAQVRNGVFPKGIDQKQLIQQIEKDQVFSKAPLTTTELMTFSTFFQKQPEKVCGQEVVTGSRDFPVTISGTREGVEKAIDQALKTKSTIELEAQALELELNLFEL